MGGEGIGGGPRGDSMEKSRGADRIMEGLAYRNRTSWRSKEELVGRWAGGRSATEGFPADGSEEMLVVRRGGKAKGRRGESTGIYVPLLRSTLASSHA